jgi:hypothetical protein
MHAGFRIAGWKHGGMAGRGAAAALAVGLLAACSGGGGSIVAAGAAPVVPPTSETPVDPVVPQAPVTQTFTVTLDSLSSAFALGSSAGSGSLGAPAGTSGTLAYDVQDGMIVAARGTIAGVALDIDTRDGDTITVANGVVTAEDAATGALVSFQQPGTTGFMHQTFGLWEQDPNAGQVGIAIGGTPTPSAAMPSPGTLTATYTGKARGYSSFSGTISTTTADMTLTTDFATATFATTGTMREGIDFTTPQRAPEHDLNGRLTVTGAGLAGRVRSGQGEVSTVGRVSVTGSFFGPNAEEVGGTFTNNGEAGQFFGAFGGGR